MVGPPINTSRFSFKWHSHEKGFLGTMSANPEPGNVPAQQVKKLRELTGAGFSDCRQALVHSTGDMDKAVEYLRKKGQAAAQNS